MLLYFAAVQDQKSPLPMSESGLRQRVEPRGFEPLTPSMRTRCATGLRYGPLNLGKVTKPVDRSANG